MRYDNQKTTTVKELVKFYELSNDQSDLWNGNIPIELTSKCIISLQVLTKMLFCQKPVFNYDTRNVVGCAQPAGFTDKE